MAITKILNIKESAKGTSTHLFNSIKYILNPEKTKNGLLIGGNVGTECGEVYRAMMDTKNDWGKLNGRQGYHFVISWKPGETDEQTAYQVIKEFCEEYLGEDYDYVFSIHNDQEHMHGHIVFNSVNRMNGYKYRYERGDWEKYIQPTTDKICEKYHLKKLSYDRENRKGCSYAQHMAEKNGKQNWKKIIQADIDYAVSDSESYDTFLKNMKRMGYTVKEGYSRKKERAQLSFRAPGQKRAWRDDKLGENYRLENIRKRVGIEKREYRTLKPPTVKGGSFSSLHTRMVREKYRPYSSLSRYQIRRVRTWHKTRTWLKNPYAVNAGKIRQNLLQIHRLHEDCCYLIRNGIRNEQELILREKLLQEKEKEMKDLRQGYYLLNSDETFHEYQALQHELFHTPWEDDRFETILDQMESLEDKLPEAAYMAEEQFQSINEKLMSLRYEKRIIRHIKKTEPDLYIMPINKQNKTMERRKEALWQKK